MARAKNARQRRELLKLLRTMTNSLKTLASHWDVAGTIPAEGWRERRPEEYPEAQAQSWAYVYNTADELIKQLTALREEALQRWQETLPQTEVRR